MKVYQFSYDISLGASPSGVPLTSQSLLLSIQNNQLRMERFSSQPHVFNIGGALANSGSTLFQQALHGVRVNLNLATDQINLFASANLLYPGGELMKFAEKDGVSLNYPFTFKAVILCFRFSQSATCTCMETSQTRVPPLPLVRATTVAVQRTVNATPRLTARRCVASAFCPFRS